ncbi:MerR family transcriptional regulator [soil metagenome]
MTTLRISDVAACTGVPATTLRYYEQIGLIPVASRADNGYRTYQDHDLGRLRFIARARQLDLALDDLRALVEAWASDDCAHVQQRMAHMVQVRHGETMARIAEFGELADHLQQAADRLAGASAAGPCDDDCACGADDPPPPLVTSTAEDTLPVEEVEIACTLDAGDMSGRLEEWQDVIARATHRSPIADGVALRFAHDMDLTTALARLCAAEHACCSFFRFALLIDSHGVRLEVRSPPEARDMLTAAVFGTPGASIGYTM